MRRLVRSFGFAFAGLAVLLREPNFRIHLVATAVVVAAGFGFGIAPSEWLAVLLCIGLVLTAEGVNTALEHLCDAVAPDLHAGVKAAKDAAAAAVLIAAASSVAVALVIFGPRVADWLGASPA